MITVIVGIVAFVAGAFIGKDTAVKFVKDQIARFKK